MIVQIIIGALMIGSIYGLMSLGYSLIYRASGLMTFVHGELFMLGGFLGLTFYKFLNFPFSVSLILTMVIMFFLGIMIEKAVIRPLLKRGATGIYIVLATISLSIIFQNFAMLAWGSNVFQFPPIFDTHFIEIGSVKIVPESLLGLIVALICMCLLHFFMTRTRLGTAMRAAALDPVAASTLGINVSLTTGITWGLSSALAAAAGILYGPIYGVSMMMGSIIGLKGFAAAVIGGYGNMYGAIVGALFLGIIETFIAGYVSSAYKDFISFFILIAVLFVKPTGLFDAEVLEE